MDWKGSCNRSPALCSPSLSSASHTGTTTERGLNMAERTTRTPTAMTPSPVTDSMANAQATGEETVEGRLTIKQDVVAKIAGMAAREVSGVSPASTGLLGNVGNIAGSGDDIRKGI